jgi:hypothetical protein
MTEKSDIRDTAEAIKGIVEAVPVYQDVVQPAAREIGAALKTVVKVIHIALSPLRALIWGFEQISDYLEDSISKRLHSIPMDRIQTPPPQIAGPAIEALRFTAQEPDLREMYANLLATAMDRETVKKTHPAFVEIIKQLNSEDARLFKLIASERYRPQPLLNLIIYGKEDKFDGGFLTLKRHISIFSKETEHQIVATAIDNFIRLRLVSLNGRLFHQPVYQTLEELDMVQQHIRKEIPSFESKIDYESIKVTDFGQMFIDACVIEQHVGLASSATESTDSG